VHEYAPPWALELCVWGFFVGIYFTCHFFEMRREMIHWRDKAHALEDWISEKDSAP
jgi:hypothetical protein